MTSKSIPPRFNWAAETIRFSPESNILEVGCGVGFLAFAIAQKLSSGKLIAIDRSEKMIATAAERNSRFILSQLVCIEQSSFEDYAAPANHFNVVVAFNVSLFYNGSSDVYKKAKRILKKEGSLYLFYQPPTNTFASVQKALEDSVRENKFQINRMLFNHKISPPVICVEAVN